MSTYGYKLWDHRLNNASRQQARVADNSIFILRECYVGDFIIRIIQHISAGHVEAGYDDGSNADLPPGWNRRTYVEIAVVWSRGDGSYDYDFDYDNRLDEAKFRREIDTAMMLFERKRVRGYDIEYTTAELNRPGGAFDRFMRTITK